MNLLNIETLIKKYQNDQDLFQILNGFLTSIKTLSKVSDPASIFDTAKEIVTPYAVDFVPSAGTWNVVGTATAIVRQYVLSADNRFMLYSWYIDASTITVAAANNLIIKLPSGYRLNLRTQSTLGMCVGNTFYNVAGGWEVGFCRIQQSSPDDVVMFRNTLINFPIGALDIRGTILLPVTKFNET
jgi:hypothetical protein